jgi:hypothetical protein
MTCIRGITHLATAVVAPRLVIQAIGGIDVVIRENVMPP